jgi:hypothetical protein
MTEIIENLQAAFSQLAKSRMNKMPLQPRAHDAAVPGLIYAWRLFRRINLCLCEKITPLRVITASAQVRISAPVPARMKPERRRHQYAFRPKGQW